MIGAEPPRAGNQMPIQFGLNGQMRAIEPEPGVSLLDVLRDRCGIHSLKDGCQPQGQCGCCLALIDGSPLVTCAVEARRVAGKQVLTGEGLTAQGRPAPPPPLLAPGRPPNGFRPP